MLKDLNFPEALKKSVYKEKKDELQAQLVMLQQRCKRESLPVVIIVEGWGSAGKGSRISDLVVDLDPRLFNVYTTEDPIGYENRLPFMARFWSRIGEHGSFTIFDQAWYDAAARGLMNARDKKAALSSGELEDFDALGKLFATDEHARSVSSEQGQEQNLSLEDYIASISSIERQLSQDGYLIVKLFLHISQATQRQRFVDLMLDPQSSWRVDKEDLRQVQRYPEYFKIFDELIAQTNYSFAPWHLVPAHEKRNASVQILQILVDSISEALDHRARLKFEQAKHSADKNQRISEAHEKLNAYLAASADKSKELEPKKLLDLQQAYTKARIGSTEKLASSFKLKKVKSLNEIRFDKTVESDEQYKQELKKEQKRLSELQSILYKLRVPVIIAYEGWDAAGKGGNIKRVARALDARSYVVHPIAAPSAVELAHPFLWRFWTKIPRTGHIAIFDRTWYGRVMVERIERFAREDEWMRAYDEINEFEAELERWGAVLIKFWINVSSDEQLRRFQERQNDPAKQWKITDEDWRNREKNDLYHVCVNDMLRLTSSQYAPWHIIESDDKRYARIKALRIINEELEAKLKDLGYK